MGSTRRIVPLRASCIVLLAGGLVVSCSSSTPSAAPSTTLVTSSEAGSSEPVAAERCIVRLHGKGGDGAPTVVSDGVAVLSPAGNADGWGARQWIYFPDDRYAEARDVVVAAADGSGCRRVVIDGFSNGGAFAAALYCAGEDLGGRLAGVVVDDPVTDDAVVACAPAPGVAVALYWTTALAGQAPAGTSCDGIDWTCSGGTVIGIDAYASALGAEVQASPFTDHQPNFDAPELATWLP
jgi:hypothetical protein